MWKYLGILVVAALLLVPLTAAAPEPVAPDESATCGAILLEIWHFGGVPGIWHIESNYQDGPFLIFYSPNSGSGTYKGCHFAPGTPLFQFGPYDTGEHPFVSEIPGDTDISGVWQVISAEQTSNVEVIP